jgi:magnesium dechelatase
MMSALNPKKLHVDLDDEVRNNPLTTPRRYTLTHSDKTGDLYLTIASSFDQHKLSNWYGKLMRDEVLGEWIFEEEPSLHIHCHVSGGFVIGPAKWRLSIFRQHMPMVLQAICYGDKDFIQEHPALQEAPVYVHFHAKQESLNEIEQWGVVKDFLPTIE